MRNRATFSVSVRVRGLRPGADPFVRLGIACLQEKSLERGASDVDCKIDEPSLNRGVDGGALFVGIKFGPPFIAHVHPCACVCSR